MTNRYNHNSFIIREYRKEDFSGISQLWVITELSNTKRGDDEKSIEDSIRLGGSLLVMEEKSTEKICGTSWMTFDGRRIHLHHFGISPEFQGKGFSKILLKASLDLVKKRGQQVKLEVHKTNKKAINLYKKYGFKSLGDYKIYIIRDIAKL
ncbi:MAG TPA: N-acetyltransferase [Bacteroidales bacterium]|nr:N-acetyltransferase [Bacteroidales bacterium]